MGDVTLKDIMTQFQCMDASLDTLSTELYQVNVYVDRIARWQVVLGGFAPEASTPPPPTTSEDEDEDEDEDDATTSEDEDDDADDATASEDDANDGDASFSGTNEMST